MQKRFVKDLNLCTGCQACRIACHIENETDLEYTWRQIQTFNERHHPELPLFHLSLACNHCIDPPCLDGCPAKAYEKDPISGAVTLDSDKCIGCKYCQWTCPFDAPKFNAHKGTIEKCSFCIHRLEEKEEPACTELCPTGALKIEDWKEDLFIFVPGFPKSTAKPAIRFVPLQGESYIPDNTPLPFDKKTIELFENAKEPPRTKTGLKTEWTLLLFSFIAPILVGLFTAAVYYPLLISPEIFIAAGASAMVLSIFHLGKKGRVFRAIAHLKKSWLSREVFFFTLFLLFSALTFFVYEQSIIIRWFTLVFGYLALFSIDKVYETAQRTGSSSIHSAQTVLTGFFIFGLVSGDFVMLGATAAIKLGFYFMRKIQFYRNDLPLRIKATIARLLFGFIIPLTFILVNPIEYYVEMIVFVFVGELIDRIEFYIEFDIKTPAKKMAADEQEMLNQQDRPGNLGL